MPHIRTYVRLMSVQCVYVYVLCVRGKDKILVTKVKRKVVAANMVVAVVAKTSFSSSGQEGAVVVVVAGRQHQRKTSKVKWLLSSVFFCSVSMWLLFCLIRSSECKDLGRRRSSSEEIDDDGGKSSSSSSSSSPLLSRQTKQLLRKRRESEVANEFSFSTGSEAAAAALPSNSCATNASSPAISSSSSSSVATANNNNTVVKIRNHMGPAHKYSIITQSILTFVTVFVFGCAIILAVFAWKRYTDSSFRYQYFKDDSKFYGFPGSQKRTG